MLLKKLRDNAVILTICSFFIAAMVYLYPHLRYPSFNLIDDGVSVEVATILHKEYSVHNWVTQLYEVQFGRLRSLYFVYFYVVRLLFGTHPFVYWFGHACTLFLTMTLVYFILKKLTKVTWLSTLIPFLLLGLPSVMENYYRLGPAEPRQVVFMLLFMLWLIGMTRAKFSYKKMLLGGALLLASYFSKETAMVLFPGFCWLWFSEVVDGKWRKKEYFLMAGFLMLLTIGFYLLIPPKTAYTTDYRITPEKLIHNLYVIRLTMPQLFWFGHIFIILSAVRFLIKLLSRQSLYSLIKEYKWLGFFFTLIAGSIALVIPWEYQLDRYYYGTHLFILFFAALELVQMYQFWIKEKQILKLSSLCILGLGVLIMIDVSSRFFPPQGSDLLSLMRKSRVGAVTWFDQYQYSGAISSYLTNKVEPGTNVYVSYNDYEVIYELGIFASQFTQRPVKVLSENAQVEKDFDDRFRTVSNIYTTFEQDPNQKKIFIVRGIPEKELKSVKENVLWPKSSWVPRDEKLVWRIFSPEVK
jgi:hypothetical protein